MKREMKLEYDASRMTRHALSPTASFGAVLLMLATTSLALMPVARAQELLWITQFGTSGGDHGAAIANYGAGGVIIAGNTEGNLGGPNAGGRDAFLARYEIDSCYADCDPSTGAGILDLFDFLCFQGSFVNGEPYACDCDTSTGVGVCDVFDFLCFQNAFVGGCP